MSSFKLVTFSLVYFNSNHTVFSENRILCYIIGWLECHFVLLSRYVQVTPISNLMSKCEALWVSRTPETKCDAETVKGDKCDEHSTSKITSCCCTIRRIFSSEDLDFVLLGFLKVSDYLCYFLMFVIKATVH